MKPLAAIPRMEDREYAMEVGGAIYFAVFITIGAFIGLNLFVVVVTTNPRIVEEVRSIRFNQEQEKVVLNRHVSKSLSILSQSTTEMREVATHQDLISALISREKVRVPSPA